MRNPVASGGLVVEKISMPEESCDRHWPVSGTTGYDFMNQVIGLFIDRDSEEVAPRISMAGYPMAGSVDCRMCCIRVPWGCCAKSNSTCTAET